MEGNNLDNPLVSFILPNYNNEHILDMFFKKFLENNTYKNYEFIVVDDGSLDESLNVLKRWKRSNLIKDMTIIAEPHNGIVNALNKALFATKGKFVIRCDGDATVETRGFVEKFINFYSIKPDKIGVITSKVIGDNGIIQAIGRNVISENGLHDRGKVIREQVQHRTFDDLTDVDPLLCDIIDSPAEVDSAVGVLTFFDRETAVKIGGFDKNYPLWIEDDDFFLQFRLHGKKCFYIPAVEVCHRFSLRGDRNPSNWGKRHFIFKKETKQNRTEYKILGLPVFKIKLEPVFKQYRLCKKYYFLGIQFFTKKIESWRAGILKHDYNYWEQKWGFSPVNPNLQIVKKRYRDTELLWNYVPRMRDEGENILNQYPCHGHRSNIKILTCYHRPFRIPSTGSYLPIFVGKALQNAPSKDGILDNQGIDFLCRNTIGDDTGDNISKLNRIYNENTAVYWAWKNLEKLNTPDFIGLAHYRRHFIFYKPENIESTHDRWLPGSTFFKFDKINYEYTKIIDPHEIITEDVILPCMFDLKNLNPNFQSPKDNYIALKHREIYYEYLIMIIKNDYPEYMSALKKFMSGTSIYICNMFVMKKDLFIEYAEFLFGVLFKIDKIVDTSSFTIHEKRGLAFLAEFILTIFIFKQQECDLFKTKELYTTYL